MPITAEDFENREFKKSEWLGVWCLLDRRLVVTVDWAAHRPVSHLGRVMAVEDVPDRWRVYAELSRRTESDLRTAVAEWYNILNPDNIEIIVEAPEE